eukprot:gene31857-39354_t
MSIDSPVSRVQRVRHELKIRQVEVLRVRAIGSHFRAITFGGPALQDFHSASFDDHVKFILGDGPDAARRDYTPRSFDPVAGELLIEFALHGDGPCAAWAAQAAPGQQVTIGGPRGSLIIPVDYEWHLLVGDETGLPAIARRLEELPRAEETSAPAFTANIATGVVVDVKIHNVKIRTHVMRPYKGCSRELLSGRNWMNSAAHYQKQRYRNCARASESST